MTMETSQTKKWSGTPERLVAPMAGPVLEFDLSHELTLLHGESEWESLGRNSKTLVKQPDLRVVLTAELMTPPPGCGGTDQGAGADAPRTSS